MFNLVRTFYLITQASHKNMVTVIRTCVPARSKQLRPPRSSHKPLATTRRTPPRAAQRVRIDGAQNLRLAPPWRRATPISAAWWPPAQATGAQPERTCTPDRGPCRAPTAAPLARIDAGACHMPWGVEGRGWVRVKTQKSSRATVSQAAHERCDCFHERMTGGGALRCVLGAREPAESTACRMRIMPICVLYVGVAWSTYTAVPHHDMSVCANADPCHQRVGAASSAQSGCATHHLTSLPNCSLPSNCWHRSI